MFIALLTTALASCIFRPDPPRSFVSTEHLGPSSPIHVSRSWEGIMNPMVQTPMLQMRLRAPDGSIVPWRAERLGIAHQRFLPEDSWQPGIYALEELGWFDDEGRRSLHKPTDNAYWFVRSRLEIHAESPPPLPEIGAVDWTYDDESGRLTGTFDKPKGTVKVGLEYKGIGQVNRYTAWQGLASTRRVKPGCDDTPQFVPLPPNTSVRVYVEGPGGATQVSSWHWHVDLRGWMRGRKVAPPSSWVELAERPSRVVPMGAVPEECPSLVASDPVAADSEGNVLADQFGAFHMVREDGEGTTVDGIPYAVARPTFLHALPDGVLLLGNTDGLHGPDGTVVATSWTGLTVRPAFEHEPLSVRWTDADGHRWRQLVDDKGVAAERVEIFLPVDVNTPDRINGRLFEVPEGTAYSRGGWADPEHAVLVHVPKGGVLPMTVSVYDAEARLVRRHRIEHVPPIDPDLPDPWMEIGSYDQGQLHVLINRKSWFHVNTDGTLTPSTRPERPVVGHLPAEQSIPWRQGRLIQNRNGVAYERDGIRTATLRGGGTLGLVKGVPVLREAKNGQLTDTSLRCGIDGSGVPMRYKPHETPNGP